jgi:hypothetical protein
VLGILSVTGKERIRVFWDGETGSPPMFGHLQFLDDSNPLQVRNAVGLERSSPYDIRITGGLHVGTRIELDGDLDHDGSKAGFFGATPTSKPTVTGSRAGNAALQSLLTALAALGMITDSTT